MTYLIYDKNGNVLASAESFTREEKAESQTYVFSNISCNEKMLLRMNRSQPSLLIAHMDDSEYQINLEKPIFSVETADDGSDLRLVVRVRKEIIENFKPIEFKDQWDTIAEYEGLLMRVVTPGGETIFGTDDEPFGLTNILSEFEGQKVQIIVRILD